MWFIFQYSIFLFAIFFVLVLYEYLVWECIIFKSIYCLISILLLNEDNNIIVLSYTPWYYYYYIKNHWTMRSYFWAFHYQHLISFNRDISTLSQLKLLLHAVYTVSIYINNRHYSLVIRCVSFQNILWLLVRC